jgi:hypothetical protein
MMNSSRNEMLSLTLVYRVPSPVLDPPIFVCKTSSDQWKFGEVPYHLHGDPAGIQKIGY